jgi:hypothetical protein
MNLNIPLWSWGLLLSNSNQDCRISNLHLSRRKMIRSTLLAFSSPSLKTTHIIGASCWQMIVPVPMFPLPLYCHQPHRHSSALCKRKAASHRCRCLKKTYQSIKKTQALFFFFFKCCQCQRLVSYQVSSSSCLHHCHNLIPPSRSFHEDWFFLSIPSVWCAGSSITN